ncbi:helix-turn-helix domain-containing protein [Alkalicoccobacillus porphyridii]|uniref:Helix-turn-helix domain-containing protein n=1 Tax=Alkalicoccobacillus porphyridii TaxID=2597270 RepID=A0A554A2F8_9BACI|nr:helix-turn-helix domain-containing protein [Alkalicoccobacillus porphyridii]TSB47868.1 helix-turn-helix domain-containing protein [Alkalicoccobacillus porphyridii]
MYKALLIDPENQSENKLVNMVDWNHHGFTLQTSSESFSKAFTQFRRRDYDTVLIHLKDADHQGLDLCKRIREESTIPLLLFGGTEEFHFVRQTIKLQVTDYLPAPLHSEDLTNSLLTIKQTLKRNKPLSLAASPNEHTITSRKSVKDKIEEVKNYVERSLNTNITLKEISDNLHYNCSYLGQKFKAQEKMTFHQYLLNRRMEKAKTLLAMTDLKIYEIASEVGYTDLDWFYKKFKSHFGVSASMYRRKYHIVPTMSVNEMHG